MFRHLTRGKNEKIQIRNVKNADYPQKGCKEMLIPSVVKTNCTQSGHIVAIRTTSTDNPSRIDSHGWHFNQGVARNSLHIPYLNLTKGKSGQTVSPFRIQGTQFSSLAGNIAETVIFKRGGFHKYWLQATSPYLFMVRSFSSPLSFSSSTLVATALDNRIVNNASRRDAMSKDLTYGYSELIHSAVQFRDMIFYNSLGGVKSGVTIRRKNSVLCYSQFKHYRTTDVLTGSPSTGVDYSFAPFSFPPDNLRVVHNIMDINGAVQYAFSSTNENANAAWLLNQRTQYGRRTNPIY